MADADLLELGLVERTPSEMKAAGPRRRAPKPRTPRTPFTADDTAMIQGLGRVTFQPASWDKRFARDMQRMLETEFDAGITDGQRTNVQRLAHKYRRQIPLNIVMEGGTVVVRISEDSNHCLPQRLIRDGETAEEASARIMYDMWESMGYTFPEPQSAT